MACSGHVNVKDIHTSKITNSRATYILSQSSGHFDIGYENDVEIGETSIGTEFSMRDRVSLIS